MTREWSVGVDPQNDATPISVQVPNTWLSVDEAVGLLDALTDAIDDVGRGRGVDVDALIDRRRGK